MCQCSHLSIHNGNILACTLYSPGIREVVLCKDKKGVVGMCLLAESKGIFVGLVKKDSPAAMAGLRFGDQILSVSCTNKCVCGA